MTKKYSYGAINVKQKVSIYLLVVMFEKVIRLPKITVKFEKVISTT